MEQGDNLFQLFDERWARLGKQLSGEAPTDDLTLPQAASGPTTALANRAGPAAGIPAQPVRWLNSGAIMGTGKRLIKSSNNSPLPHGKSTAPLCPLQFPYNLPENDATIHESLLSLYHQQNSINSLTNVHQQPPLNSLASPEHHRLQQRSRLHSLDQQQILLLDPDDRHGLRDGLHHLHLQSRRCLSLDHDHVDQHHGEIPDITVNACTETETAWMAPTSAEDNWTESPLAEPTCNVFDAGTERDELSETIALTLRNPAVITESELEISPGRMQMPPTTEIGRAFQNFFCDNNFQFNQSVSNTADMTCTEECSNSGQFRNYDKVNTNNGENADNRLMQSTCTNCGCAMSKKAGNNNQDLNISTKSIREVHGMRISSISSADSFPLYSTPEKQIESELQIMRVAANNASATNSMYDVYFDCKQSSHELLSSYQQTGVSSSCKFESLCNSCSHHSNNGFASFPRDGGSKLTVSAEAVASKPLDVEDTLYNQSLVSFEEVMSFFSAEGPELSDGYYDGSNDGELVDNCGDEERDLTNTLAGSTLSIGSPAKIIEEEQEEREGLLNTSDKFNVTTDGYDMDYSTISEATHTTSRRIKRKSTRSFKRQYSALVCQKFLTHQESFRKILDGYRCGVEFTQFSKEFPNRLAIRKKCILTDEGIFDFTLGKTAVINVGGVEFRTKLWNLSRFPTSRLGRIFRAKSTKDVLTYCDAFLTGPVPVFYFDRYCGNFPSILDMYRSSELHVTSDVCSMIIQDDLQYWGLDELFLQPCCALKYYPHIVDCKKELKEEKKIREMERLREEEETFGNSLVARTRAVLWNLLEYPETSTCARVVALISLGMVLISTLTFVIGTVIEKDLEKLMMYNITGNLYLPRTPEDIEERWETSFKDDPNKYETLDKVINAVDTVAIIFFTCEYMLKLVLAPRKLKFMVDKMNLIDLLAIIPYFLSLILEGLEDMQIIGRAGKIVRLVRVMRILRIFKMVRHFAGLQSLVYTLQLAYKELGLLFLMIMVIILLFASLIYATEKDGHIEDKWSYYDCFWWALMTLTTVGYDMNPNTLSGQFIGCLCALSGIFIITLPIPIVVSSFAVCYKNRLWKNEIVTKRRLMANLRKKEERDVQKKNLFLNLAGPFQAQTPAVVVQPKREEAKKPQPIPDGPISAITYGIPHNSRTSETLVPYDEDFEDEESIFDGDDIISLGKIEECLDDFHHGHGGSSADQLGLKDQGEDPAILQPDHEHCHSDGLIELSATGLQEDGQASEGLDQHGNTVSLLDLVEGLQHDGNDSDHQPNPDNGLDRRDGRGLSHRRQFDDGDFHQGPKNLGLFKAGINFRNHSL